MFLNWFGASWLSCFNADGSERRDTREIKETRNKDKNINVKPGKPINGSNLFWLAAVRLLLLRAFGVEIESRSKNIGIKPIF